PSPVGWRLIATEPDGRLDLRAIFDRDNISAYALAYVHAPRAQRARLLVGSDDGVKIWLNGALVHSHIVARGAAPDQDRSDVELRPGWNVVLARVFNITLAHDLYLRVEGEGLSVGPRAAAR